MVATAEQGHIDFNPNYWSACVSVGDNGCVKAELNLDGKEEESTEIEVFFESSTGECVLLGRIKKYWPESIFRFEIEGELSVSVSVRLSVEELLNDFKQWAMKVTERRNKQIEAELKLIQTL